MKNSEIKIYIFKFLSFLIFLIVGMFFIKLNKNKIINNSFAIGKHTISLFILLPLSFFYFFINNIYDIYNNSKKNVITVVLSLLLFIILTLNFYDIFFYKVKYNKSDDSYRYSVYAHNIVKNMTLWGGDGLIYKNNQKNYIDQPGYRYLIALEILIFGDEYRLTQIFNIFLFFITILFLSISLKNYVSLKFYICFNLLIFLSTFYITKNIIMSNTEWLVLIIYFLFFILMLKRYYKSAFILLGLTSFIRQNLVLITLFLAVYLYLILDRKILLFIFFIIFFLPLYHNLYYAHKFKFFVTNKGVYKYKKASNTVDYIKIGCKVFFYKLLGYFGYSEEVIKKFTSFIIGFLFIPYGSFLMLYLIFRRKGTIFKWQFRLIIFLLISSPTLILGGGYYPRFECVNIYLTILTIILIEHYSNIKFNNITIQKIYEKVIYQSH